MKEFLGGSLFFGAALTVVAYAAGLYIGKKRTFFLLNPLLIAIAITIGALLLMGVDYKSYNNSGKYISYLLTPGTVALAIPLYEQVKLLKKNFTAISD